MQIYSPFQNYMYPSPVSIGAPLVTGRAYNKKKEKKTRYELLEPTMIEKTLTGYRATKNVTQTNLPLQNVMTAYPPQYFNYARPCMTDFIRDNRSIKLTIDSIKLNWPPNFIEFNSQQITQFAEMFGVSVVPVVAGAGDNIVARREELNTKIKIKEYNSTELLSMVVEKVCKDILNRENTVTTMVFTRSVKAEMNDEKKAKITIEFNTLSCKLKFYAMVLGNFVSNFPGFMSVCNTIPPMGFGMGMGMGCGIQMGEMIKKAEEQMKKTIKNAWVHFIKEGTPKNSSSGGGDIHELKLLSNNKKYRKEYFLNESQTYTYVCDRILNELCKRKVRKDKDLFSTLLSDYKKYYNAVNYLNKHYHKYLE